MFYEIPREIFKQKLLDRTNLHVIQVGSESGHDYKEVTQFDNPFDADSFINKFPTKATTYIFFGFDVNGMNAKKAAEQISQNGYPYVFFYQGILEKDKILDKGIN